jgi:glycerol-3-phosphate dehydrogenase
MNRLQLLERLRRENFDILVVGGGATGCGIALDAASRGLRTALVEKQDFSEGTSSRSTKLIHGGVRYLEQAVKKLDRGQFNLVRDALHERALLLRLAPHLSRKLQLVTPLKRWWEVPYYWIGLMLYDLLSGRASIGRSVYMTRARTLQRYPTLRAEGLVGSVAYFDGQFDDARMNVELAVTAVEQGAVAVNHVEVTALEKDGGRLSGAALRDTLSGETFKVKARVIINAAGPFCDLIRRMDDPQCDPMLTTSSGVHIILDAAYAPPDLGMLIPKTEDGRVLFALPWMDYTLVGTTDSPAPLAEHVPVLEEEIEYILRHLRLYLDRPVARKDVKAAWSGLRPLVSNPKAGGTAKLSRDHVIADSPAGLITITGGKWTTYRKMAQDAVNHAVARGGLNPQHTCRTIQIPMVGAAGFDAQAALKLAAEYKLDEDIARHLHLAYGGRAARVAELAAKGFARRLAEGHPEIEAEVIWAVREELALTAMDVLARRTRLAFIDTQAARAALPRTLELMASELGWSKARRAQEDRESRGLLEQGL